MEDVRMVLGWCELRGDFRHFRTDRITTAAVQEERFKERTAILRTRWERQQQAERDRRSAAQSCAAE
jgi:predicted DNA-binding transcriptional regulator YafY